MDAPQIRYARTSDGVNIAYWAIGSGTPIVTIDLPASNVEHEWATPSIRAQIEETARVARLVRYDHRGFGLSDKDDQDFTTEAFVQDLEAVVDRLELGRFFLIASRGPTYPIGLAYARRHPERVLRMAAMIGGPPMEFTEASLDTPGADWGFFAETIARRVAGWNDEAAASEMAEHLRQSIDEAGFRRFVRWSIGVRQRQLPGLSEIKTPCLFMPVNIGGSDWIEEARGFASEMPDAVVRPIPGRTADERAQQVRRAVTEFFTQGVAVPPSPVTVANEPSESRVILFIDIADSTALTEHMGDAAFRTASRGLDEKLRAVIRDGGGLPIEGKVLGDGVMATFASAREAIAAALRCNQLSAETELRLHLGLHAGDVIREPGNVYGGAVNLAARICDASPAGAILVSDVVRGMARTSAGVSFEDMGERTLKGIGEPVRVYRVVA